MDEKGRQIPNSATCMHIHAQAKTHTYRHAQACTCEQTLHTQLRVGGKTEGSPWGLDTEVEDGKLESI